MKYAPLPCSVPFCERAVPEGPGLAPVRNDRGDPVCGRHASEEDLLRAARAARPLPPRGIRP